MTEFIEITTAELANRIDDPNIRIIDARLIDAYNGWKLGGESRGGHIKGAKTLPPKWLEYPDWLDFVEEKHILPQNYIVIYGYSEDDIMKTAEKFADSGYEKIFVYKHFIDDWSVNPELPMDRLPRYRHLVPAQWVKTLTDGGIPDEHDGRRTVILHTHYRNRNAYLSGHIPGAIDMDTLTIESPETWNRRLPQELKEAFQAHGITADTTVVVYGKFMAPDNADAFPGSAAGQIAAFRTALVLMYAGVKDVRILNGGFQAWEDAGYPVSNDEVAKHAVGDFGVPIPAEPELFVDLPEAKAMLKSSDAELVCVRSWEEFIGEESGYNYIEKKGRIPGAVFGNCGSDAYHMENYRNPDHTSREFHEVAERWKSVGITPDKHLAFYCGTGWRGSEAFFSAWMMGWPHVAVYDGGWFEWSKDANNPFETGIPEL